MAAPSVVGTSIVLDGRQVEVVGVMPAGFAFPAARQVWRPIEIEARQGFVQVVRKGRARAIGGSHEMRI